MLMQDILVKTFFSKHEFKTFRYLQKNIDAEQLLNGERLLPNATLCTVQSFTAGGKE